MLESLFETLGLKREHAELYTTLLQNGPMQAAAISKKMRVPRATLYNLLYDLRDQKLVTQNLKKETKVWIANPPEQIRRLIDQKMNVLDQMRVSSSSVITALEKNIRTDFVPPAVQVFEGAESMRQALFDILLYRNIATDAFWPAKDMVEILGKDFFAYHNEQRIRQNISLRTIWPKSKAFAIKDAPFLSPGSDFKREIRIAPSNIECSMGYWAYENKVVFISSKREGFGFIVQSIELRELLRTQFEVLWSVSKKLNDYPKEAKEFLRKAGLKDRY